MKFLKFAFTILIILIILFLLSGCNTNGNNNKNNQANNNAKFTKLSTEKSEITNDNINNTQNNENSQNNNNSENNNTKTPVETELTTFSTPLKSGGPNRLVNIKLTCDKINEKVLQNGESFSFNQIVGPCKSEEGYKKAEIYVNKKIQYALGGGNCQVSTTLYNAVLAVPGLEITERHEHKRKRC